MKNFTKFAGNVGLCNAALSVALMWVIGSDVRIDDTGALRVSASSGV